MKALVTGLVLALAVWFAYKVLWLAVMGFFVGLLVVWLVNSIYPNRRL